MRVERRADGTLIVEPVTELPPFVPNLPAQLAERVAQHPDRLCLAQRAAPGGPWIRRSFAEFKAESDAVTQWLLDRRIPAGRSLLILSGNSIAHAVVKFGGFAAGVPVCPVSANYALMPGDFGRLRHVVSIVKPAVVFAEPTEPFRRALETVDFGDAVVVTTDPAALTRPAVAYADVLATPVTPAVARAIETSDPDAHAAYMLTSGSTSMPKAVVQTQRMIAANVAQGRFVLSRTAGWDDVMVDWLPWSHVSGACNQFATLCSGGSFYIDGGRPMPGLFDESLRNIKEIPPSFHINVPFGYAMLVDALEKDAELRSRFFTQPAPRAVRRRRIAAGAVRAIPATRHRDDRRADLLHDRLRGDRNDVGLHVDLFPDRGSRHRPADAGHDPEAGAERAALRGPGPRADRDAGLPVEPGGESRHLRRGRLLSHGRHRTVPRSAGHPEGTAVRRAPRRRLQARHRLRGWRPGACAPSSSKRFRR